MPTVAFAADELPNLTDPKTSGISGGVDWKIENDTLTISPSATPEEGYGSGQMVEDYHTFEAPNDDYKNALIEAGIVKNPRDGVKILGNGELTKKLNVKVNAVSETAKTKIEAAGGTVEVI